MAYAATGGMGDDGPLPTSGRDLEVERADPADLVGAGVSLFQPWQTSALVVVHNCGEPVSGHLPVCVVQNITYLLNVVAIRGC